MQAPLLVVADGEPEVEERYTFRIQTVNGFARHKNEAATVVVAKSDHPYGQFFLATSDNKRFATVGEGVGEVKLSILRVGGTKGDVPVMYKVQRIGQTSEADFFPAAGNVTVPEGETRADFSIFVVDDAIPELAEKNDCIAASD